MAQPSPEYFISHLIGHVPEPEKTVDVWPLHVTIIPPFYLPSSAEEDDVLERAASIGSRLKEIKLGFGAIRAGAIPLEVGKRALYGEKNDIQVVEVLDQSGRLHDLHTQLLDNLEAEGCRLTDSTPQWIRSNYAPHATMKSGHALDRPFFCTTVTLHRKTLSSKVIVRTVDLITAGSLS